jgi:hypothetical protein
VIHLTPRPANDTIPLGGCDACGGRDHDSSAHRDPVEAMEMCMRHTSRADSLVLRGMGRPDPDGARANAIRHHRTMAEMWRQTADGLAERMRRAGK